METENQTEEQGEYLDLAEPTEPAEQEENTFDIGIDMGNFEQALSIPTAEDFNEALGF